MATRCRRLLPNSRVLACGEKLNDRGGARMIERRVRRPLCRATLAIPREEGPHLSAQQRIREAAVAAETTPPRPHQLTLGSLSRVAIGAAAAAGGGGEQRVRARRADPPLPLDFQVRSTATVGTPSPLIRTDGKEKPVGVREDMRDM